MELVRKRQDGLFLTATFLSQKDKAKVCTFAFACLLVAVKMGIFDIIFGQYV